MNRPIQIAGCTLGILIIGACSSTGTGYSQKPATYGSAAATATHVTMSDSGPAGIAVAQHSGDTMLTDGHGRALYLFEADTGTTSTCTGECAQSWPPLTTTGAPVANTGVNGALLATSPRADGTQQVTYNGHPLYYFSGDRGPGVANGQGVNGFGAKWYLLTPAGLKIDDD